MKISLLLVFCFYQAHAQSDWNLKIDKEQIKVFNRSSESSKFNEIKVEATYACAPSKLVSVVFDVPNHKRWSYATKNSRILKTISPTEIIFYKEIESPPTVENRDLVARMWVTTDNVTGVVTLRVVTVEGFVPIQEDIVRVPLSDETWIITPVGNSSKLDYYLKVDPGGSVAAFLVNMFASKAPFETFKALRHEVE